MKKPGGRKMQVNIQVPGDLEAIYTNFAVIAHTPSEVIIDFATVLPNMPKSRVQVRIVATPLHAKMMLKALAENLDRYESQYGEIKIPAEGDVLARQLFGGGKPPSPPDSSES